MSKRATLEPIACLISSTSCRPGGSVSNRASIWGFPTPTPAVRGHQFVSDGAGRVLTPTGQIDALDFVQIDQSVGLR